MSQWCCVNEPHCRVDCPSSPSTLTSCHNDMISYHGVDDRYDTAFMRAHSQMHAAEMTDFHSLRMILYLLHLPPQSLVNFRLMQGYIESWCACQVRIAITFSLIVSLSTPVSSIAPCFSCIYGKSHQAKKQRNV